MEIYYQSPHSVALKSSALTVAINRPKQAKKTVYPSVILQTFPLFDAPWWGEDEALDEEQTVFTGAGEYEKMGVHIRAISSETVYQGNIAQATSYVVNMDGIACCVLAPLTTSKKVKELVSAVGEAEAVIVFCCENKEIKMQATDVGNALASLGARVLVLVGEDEQLKKKIVREVGGESESATNKYTLKKKDLVGGSVKVILLG